VHGRSFSFICADSYLGSLEEVKVKVKSKSKKRARSDSESDSGLESEDIDAMVCMEDPLLLFVLTLT
jgi:hypothetical protein